MTSDRSARLASLTREYFAARAGGVAAVREAIPRMVTEDFRWQSSGYPVIEGVDAMLGLLDDQAAIDYRNSRIDIVHLACDEDAVLTERVDTLFDSRGDVIASVEIMGRLTFRGERIAVHRDYFDPSGHRPTARPGEAR
jgi:limonene-1,2-epoxide hydrolase